MAAMTKRRRSIEEAVTAHKLYAVEEAIELLQKVRLEKFIESCDVAVMLGIDPRKSEQAVRGAVVLPHGTGKTVRVAVFTQGANVEKALAAGADMVGMDDLAQEIQTGNFNFDVVIASPDAMGVVGRLGPVLGPRGLMPNPKVGTVAADVATAVRNAKGGQVRYRADKNGIVHASIGKIDFTNGSLKENLEALLADLRRMKPSTSKGIYVKKITLSSTMGPGLVLDQSSVNF